MNNQNMSKAVKNTSFNDLASSKHSYIDDSIALFSGTLFVGIALILFEQAGLLTGSTAGVAFIIHYTAGWPFGLIYFLINLPFYWFSWKYVGKSFTIKTFISIALLSLMTYVVPLYLHIDYLHPLFASVVGGIMLGTGVLFLARHQSSLGGVTIISLYLQEKFGISAGKTQMTVDCIVVMLALVAIPYQQVMWSILAAVIMGIFLTLNHRPGRYTGR